MNFRDRLSSKQLILGTWVKTPDRIVTEVLATTSLDVLCLDAEHSPFDRRAMDGSIVASRAADMPILVRTPSNAPSDILNALDLGATGVVIPHIRNGEEAKAAVRFSMFGPNGRGYAGSTRAASFACCDLADHIDTSLEQTTIIAQLEDREIMDHLDDIFDVDRIDCFFIGRVDLAVSLGARTLSDDRVLQAVEKITQRAHARNRCVGMFVGDLKEIPHWVARGVTLFLLQSDQSFLMAGAEGLRSSFDALVASDVPEQKNRNSESE